MVEFQVVVEMLATSESELQTMMNWIVTTFGSKVSQANALGESKRLNFIIIETSFNDAVTTIATLKSNYETQLGGNWQISYSPPA